MKRQKIDPPIPYKCSKWWGHITESINDGEVFVILKNDGTTIYVSGDDEGNRVLLQPPKRGD